MILKKLSFFGLCAIIAAATILACREDFTSEDFLKLRNELVKEKEQRDSAYLAAMSEEQAESYIEALNEAGDLMSVTVLVRENGTPVAGVSVSLASGVVASESGRVQDIITVVTDASGRAVFERATIGDNIISLTKANYVSASARVDFGAPAAPTPITTNVNGTSVIRYVAPPKRFENFSLPLYATTITEGNTAVIQGTFRIENDLTNDPTERDPIPAGLVVAADLSTALLAEGNITSSCNCVQDYRFSGTAGSLGVANINPTTGEFSMRVPATADGTDINIIYPIITGTQRIAVRRLNGVDIAPEYRQVPVRWDPNAIASGPIPFIPGARPVFTYNGSATPAPAGRGFTINNFTPVARPLELGTISSTGNTTLGATTYRINSRGSNFAHSPEVIISGGGGSGATATSSIRTLVTSVTITNGGEGYDANTNYDIELTFTDAAGTTQVYATIQDVMSNADKMLPVGPLVLTSEFKEPFILPQNTQGTLGARVIENDMPGVVPAGVTPASISVIQMTELNSIEITNGGSVYTNDLDDLVITLDGGGSLPNRTATQASVSIAAFRTQFDFSLPVDVATTAYRVLPSSIVFTYPTNAVDGQVIENIDPTPFSSNNGGQVDMINPVGTVAINSANLIDHVTTDGTNIIARNTAHTFRTDRAWTSAPQVSVVDRIIQAAAANVSVGSNLFAGQIFFIDPATDVSNSTRLIPNAANTVTGQGYDGISVEIVPTIAGDDARGSGAVFNLTTTQDVNTKVVSWSGATTFLSRGANYLNNLNRTNSPQNYTGGNSPINVQTGKVYNLTVNAGTGVRLENIEN